MGKAIQLATWIAGRFKRKIIASRVQTRVEKPNTGNTLMVMPMAITSANLEGVKPCFNRLIRGR